MPRCLIGLGANLGDRARALSQAADRLAAGGGVRVLARSRPIETVAVGGPANQARYLNSAVLLETSLGPEALLDLLQQIEHELGRQRQVRWGARTLDLDLLLYDDLVINLPRLKVPHPRMAVRRFVLEPAVEIAGDMVDPETGRTLTELWRHLLDADPYAAIAGLPQTGKTWLARQLTNTPGRRLIADPAAATDAVAERDSSGRGLRSEIEFLACRRQALAQIKRNSLVDWAVSDFWLDQSLAWATDADASTQASVQAAWQQMEPEVARPKLLIVLGRPAENAKLQQVADALERLSRRPGSPPVLRLAADDPPSVLQEAAAALQAMQ